MCLSQTVFILWKRKREYAFTEAYPSILLWFLCINFYDGSSNLKSFLLVPFTQLHGWWHIFAGYSSYLHIIFCLHHRQIFLKEKSTLTFQPWIGITIEKVIANQISPLGKLSAHTKTYAANDDAKNKWNKDFGIILILSNVRLWQVRALSISIPTRRLGWLLFFIYYFCIW